MSAVKNLLFLILLILTVTPVVAQKTVVTGKVTDGGSSEGLPFVSVFYEGTPAGVYTDEQGNFSIETTTPKDSLAFSFFGYQTTRRAVKKGVTQTINVSLFPEAKALQTVVLTNKEDPAYGVIRKAVKNKDNYDKRSLDAYEYESFTSVVAGFDKIPEKLQKRKVGEQVSQVLDSLIREKGESASLPFFSSESVARFFYHKNPEKSKKHITGTRVTGVFVKDGSLVSQLIGSAFKNFNFYENYITIVNKNFMSPLADGSMGFYEYGMLDTLTHGKYPVYEIKVTPKREQDLAFDGKIWIEDSTYALKSVDLKVSKDANINYISGIKIEQDLAPTESGPWLPEFTDVYIGISGLSEGWSGLEANFKSFNSDFKVNAPQNLKFYDEPVVLDEDAGNKKDDFWKEKRVKPLTQEEKELYALIDTVKNLPSVKTFVEVVEVVVNGYYEAGPIDIGPYIYTFAYNEIEGFRGRLGFRTNKNFSDKWVLGGYAAYGTKDEIFKYSGKVSYIASRKNWTEIYGSYTYDLDQVAIPEERIDRNQLLIAFSKWNQIVGPTYNRTASVGVTRQITKDYSQAIELRNKIYEPKFEFGYLSEVSGSDTTVTERIHTSEVILEGRFAKDEVFVQRGNTRMSLGTKSWPAFNLKVTLGLKDVLNSDLSYQKVDLTVYDRIPMGAIGQSFLNFGVGKIFGDVPLPLLEVHIGNESPFYTIAGFNLMNYFEFVSDEYVTLKYNHHFNGFIFNRIPLIRDLKWRFLTTAGLVYGRLSDKNRSFPATSNSNDNENMPLRSLEDKPYVEVGYGIENIFKVFRVDAFHRLTYLDNTNANSFGVKLAVQIKL